MHVYNILYVLIVFFVCGFSTSTSLVTQRTSISDRVTSNTSSTAANNNIADSTVAGQGNNVFSGFDAEFLADAFNVDVETARKLQSNQDNRRNIVRVEGKLQMVRPHGSREEWQREERQERQREQERERQRRQGGRGRDENGLEETICSLRLTENIGDRSRADIYTEQAGRINTANSLTFPVLRWLQLSAERGDLERVRT